MVEELDLPVDIQRQLLEEPGYSCGNATRRSSVWESVQPGEEASLSNVSSTDSLDILLEKQRQRQLNHPLHQNHIRACLVDGSNKEPLLRHSQVKETTKVSLEYDPVSRRKVLNTYEIIRELGHGQHGKVKLARELVTKQLVAIKIVNRHKKRTLKDQWTSRLKNARSSSSMEDEKIKREIAIMKKCHHEHVVRLIEVLDDAKSRKIYLVLEYCSKGEIKWCPGDIIETKARGPPLLSFQRTREIFRGVVLGLEYLHYQGIIHRDIKPANLLLSKNGTVKISDFGVSLAASSDSTNDNLHQLELAKTAGTPAFFAPEICLVEDTTKNVGLDPDSNPIISFPIDIWALGVTLHCLLFGKLPFISDFELELFEMIVNDVLTFSSYADVKKCTVSQVEDEDEYEMAKDLLQKLLEKNPLKRLTIAEAKRHPWVCWDFEHFSGKDDQFIASKLTEQCNFQKVQSEESEQISISEHELDAAVGGIGHKLKQSLKRMVPLFNDKDSGIKNDQQMGDYTYRSKNDAFSNDPNLNDRFLANCMSSADNGDLILSEELFSAPSPTFNQHSFTPPLSASFGGQKNTVSAREIFQQELQRFDDSRNPDSIVSLPVNSSFASLDSFYIDNFAMKNTNESVPQISSSQYQKHEMFERPYVGILSKPGSNGRVPTQNTLRIASPSALHIDALTMNSGISGRNPRVNSYSPVLSPAGDRSRRTSNDFPNAAFNNRLKMTSVDHWNERQQAGMPKASGRVESRLHQPLKQLQEKNVLKKPNHIFDGLNGSDEDDSQSTRSYEEPLNHLDDIVETGNKYRDDQRFYYSDSHSDTESLPFEFGIDSEHGSVLSLGDLGRTGNRPVEALFVDEFDQHSAEFKTSKDHSGKDIRTSSTSKVFIPVAINDTSSATIPIISSDGNVAIDEVEVPVEMLNLIPETQDNNMYHSVPYQNHGASSNYLFQQISTPVLPTTQESNADHLVRMNKTTEARDFLHNVLSTNISSRADSCSDIRSSVLGAHKNEPEETFVNHYSGHPKTKYQSNREEKGENENKTLPSRYRSKSFSVGLLKDNKNPIK